jgi:hypothetical protein
VGSLFLGRDDYPMREPEPGACHLQALRQPAALTRLPQAAAARSAIAERVFDDIGLLKLPARA